MSRGFLSGLWLLGASIALISCGEALGPNGERIVNVVDKEFEPSTKTIAAGETVLWQWGDVRFPHNVTWADASGTEPSPTQTSGTYSRTFAVGGTYVYYCTIHGTPTGGMRGAVVVQFQ